MLQGILIKANAEGDRLLSSIRRAVLDGRTDLPFLQVRPHPQLLERQMQPWRLGTFLLGIFGALALYRQIALGRCRDGVSRECETTRALATEKKVLEELSDAGRGRLTTRPDR